MKYLRLILATAAIMLAAVACNHEDRLGGGSSHGSSNNNNGGGQQNTGGMPQAYKNRTDWTVSYMGRGDDDKMGRVELIDINVSGAKWFVIRTITPGEYDKYYSKVADFIEDEISGLREIAAEERQAVTNYCEKPDGLMTYYFPWMFSGDMMTFVIGITDQGWPSGDYALAQYTIEPDPEDEYYPKWLGNWTISNGMVGYKIEVSRAEPNLAYYIKGWETGDSISESSGTQMDQEELFTYYNSATHNMDFISLHFTTYPDDNLGDVDEFFIGRIKDKNNEWWDVLSEDEVIAVAKLDEDEKGAKVTGANIKTSLGEVSYIGPYTKMQYVCVDSNGTIYLYNDNVPSLPLTMIKIVEEGPQPVSMREVRRTRGNRPKVVRNHPVGSTSLVARSTPKCSPSSKR